MLNTATSSQILLKHGAPAQTAFDQLCTAMAITSTAPSSAEDFGVKIMEMLTLAESALPDLQKQNNFSYAIGEGGAYRASIKAVVLASFSVIA